MKFLVTVHAGEKCPKGYGIAWRNLMTDSSVTCPIPFHRAIRWVRDKYQKFCFPKPTKEETKLNKLVQKLRCGKYSAQHDRIRNYDKGYYQALHDSYVILTKKTYPPTFNEFQERNANGKLPW